MTTRRKEGIDKRGKEASKSKETKANSCAAAGCAPIETPIDGHQLGTQAVVQLLGHCRRWCSSQWYQQYQNKQITPKEDAAAVAASTGPNNTDCLNWLVCSLIVLN